MAKKQLRIAITPSDELYEALKAFSDTSGLAMSSFCKQMLEESIPTIIAMTSAYKVAYERPDEALTIMGDMLETAKGVTTQASLDLEDEKEIIKIRKRRNDRLAKT